MLAADAIRLVLRLFPLAKLCKPLSDRLPFRDWFGALDVRRVRRDNPGCPLVERVEEANPQRKDAQLEKALQYAHDDGLKPRQEHGRACLLSVVKEANPCDAAKEISLAAADHRAEHTGDGQIEAEGIREHVEKDAP